MKYFLREKPYWVKGGVAGVVIGFALFLVVFSVYPQVDNLYVIYPVYILCQAGLECTFGDSSAESFVFGSSGFVTSIFIHFIIYFSIGAFVGLLAGKIKRHSTSDDRFYSQ